MTANDEAGGDSTTARDDPDARIIRALDVLLRYGQTDGAHHKAWVIDQAVRALTGPAYDETIADWCDGDDGPETYEWDEGIAP